MSAHNAATTEMLEAVVNGTVPVAKATNAASATMAQKAAAFSSGAGSATRPVYIDENGVPQPVANEINVNISGTAAAATNAENAKAAQTATTAEAANRATADASGNNIENTYAKQNGSYSWMSAGYATRAAQDEGGNNIIDTYATKSENAAKLDAPTIEQHTIVEGTIWLNLTDDELPYKFSVTIRATTTIGDNAIVELYNDQPSLFATYGFSIASVSGQTLTIYALEAPTSEITLTIGITN